MATDSKMSLAVLDDYLGVAEPVLAPLSSCINIVDFPETLQATDTDEREQLIERLRLSR